jgi:hypothetical protein
VSDTYRFDPVADQIGSTVTVGGVTGRLVAVSEGGEGTMTPDPWLALTILPAGERLARTVTVPKGTPVEVTR